MSQLIFTEEKTVHSIGVIGGGVNEMPKSIWPKIPQTESYQTHLCTLFPSFFRNGNLSKNRNISIFISIEEHVLGGVKEFISSKYTIHQKDDLELLGEGFSEVLIYDLKEKVENLNLSPIFLEQKYFEISSDAEIHMKKEHIFFEKYGMGMNVSKLQNISCFEQDFITPSRKYQFYL